MTVFLKVGRITPLGQLISQGVKKPKEAIGGKTTQKGGNAQPIIELTSVPY